MVVVVVVVELVVVVVVQVQVDQLKQLEIEDDVSKNVFVVHVVGVSYFMLLYPWGVARNWEG